MSVERARQLRKRMTPQEVKLWVRLREMRPLCFHPRRQAPVEDFVVDFAFRRERIAIEIDGGQHGGSDDIARDAALGQAGYDVLRFWNSDVDQNLDGVMETIYARLMARRDGL